jgi:hypothetical protein
MRTEPMPTQTRVATFVMVVMATAIGFVPPAGSADGTSDVGAPTHSRR